MANPKVLVVEDDKVILSREKWRLSKRGCEVCGSAATGAGAMECVAKMRPDIVVMDITLKGAMDGRETADQIKKNSISRSFLSHPLPIRKSSPGQKQSTLMVLSKNPLMMMP